MVRSAASIFDAARLEPYNSGLLTACPRGRSSFETRRFCRAPLLRMRRRQAPGPASQSHHGIARIWAELGPRPDQPDDGRPVFRESFLNIAVSPGSWPALVLNADFRPLSYYPLSIWSWQDTIKAVFLERVNIVALYDHAVHSPSLEMKLPSVVSLKNYVRPLRQPAFTRFNVFL